MVIGQVSCSVRSLKSTLSFSVPIWVLFPKPDAYEKLDGGFVMKAWLPKPEQVAESRQASMAKVTALRAQSSEDDPMDPSLESRPNPSAQLSPYSSQSEPPYPPTHLLQGVYWYKSWEEFFQK